MTKLTAVIIDSKEPKWVQELRFKTLVPTIASLHVGDAWLTTDDGQTIIVERKAASDLINSVLDDGLRNQCVRIANEQTAKTDDTERVVMAGFLPILWEQSGHDFAQFSNLIAQNPMVTQYFSAISPEAQLAMGQTATWNCLVYTMPEVRGEFVVLNGQTSKIRWRHILGVLVDAQELGITCIPIAADSEYGGTLEWIATRNHGEVKAKAHRRKGIMEKPDEYFISGLPSIDNRAESLIKQCGSAAWAINWLTTLNADYKIRGIADKTKKKIRSMLGLETDERLGVINTFLEHTASSNYHIPIGQEEGHIWADKGGMVAVVELLRQARPDDPALKKLLEKEK